MTAGLSSASDCRIASARRYDSSASAGLPVCADRIADLVVAGRQLAPEFGDVGVVVGHLLLDRQRAAVHLQRFGRLAGIRQQEADVVEAVDQAVSEFGDVGVVVDQLLLDRERPLERLQRLGRLAGLRQQKTDIALGPRQAVSEFGNGGVVVG